MAPPDVLLFIISVVIIPSIQHVRSTQPPYLKARVVHHSSSVPLRPSTYSSFSIKHGSSTPPPAIGTHLISASPAATMSNSGRYHDYSAGRVPENTTGDTIMNPFGTQVITLNEPFGQYFATMEVGSPASEIAVIIDTGSEITWVQCQPCLQCGSQIRDPIFDPSKSHSYRTLPCNSAWCHDKTGLAVGCQNVEKLRPPAQYYTSNPTTSTTNYPCFYNASYGDNSISYGELSVDTLRMPSVGGISELALHKFIFGCGLQNSGVETDFNASGLMGLDRGSLSIVSQLGVKKFSYCLPDRAHNIDVTGFIVFGNLDAISMLKAGYGGNEVASEEVVPPLQYFKLLLNSKTSFYAQSYYVNLTGIRLGKNLLPIPASFFEIDEHSGYGGTIIDTGTSLTSFMDLVYATFRDAVRSSISGSAREVYVPELPSFDSCYSVERGEGVPEMPEMMLQFDGGRAEMVIPDSNVWLQVGTEGRRTLYCLAFAAAGEGAGGRNVIGNFQQQNMMVEYDIGRGRIGFVHVPRCSSSSNGGHGSSLQARLQLLFISITVLVASFLLD